MKKIKAKYESNKKAKVGEKCICPSCGAEFIKTNYQQVFCKTRTGTRCKDKYWNTVTPEKRCNTTRISPASARWTQQQIDNRERRESDYRYYEWDHPFSSDALGQD